MGRIFAGHHVSRAAALAAVLPLEVSAALVAAAEREPNPPRWPASVQIFGPGDDPSIIETSVRAAFAENGGHAPSDHGQFSSNRYAFLFRPGAYRVDVPVGYYTQVLGLGLDPRDVVFEGSRGVYSEEGDQSDINGALSTFWRGAENFRNKANLLWAVSQAAPLRRMVADQDLQVSQYVGGVGMGYSSGGFVANVQVGGAFQAGSQQQFCTRNSALGRGMQGGVWNMVFIGTQGAPANHCGQGGGRPGSVTVERAPVVAEKPFVRVDASGRFELRVPPVRFDSSGPDFGAGDAVDFADVFVASPRDSAAVINARLAAGFHVVLTPGIYNVDEPLEIRRTNQVLLGLGFATLVATMGNAVIRVADVDGVRIAGLLLQAGPINSPTLLEWGTGNSAYPGNAENPGFLHDVFARVGGPNDPAEVQVAAEVMIRINSGHVVGDNLWLWRADHGIAGLVRDGANPCRTGLVVSGPDVTMYGLAVEHTLGDLVQWSGERGQTFFYQSELPYDVTPAFGTEGYVGYRVNDTVTSHRAVGVGVYHFFRDYEVEVNHGIAAPAWLANSFEAAFGVYLTGKGRMLNVINDRGGLTAQGQQAKWVCDKGPDVPYVPPRTTSPPTTLTPSTPAPTTSTTPSPPTTTLSPSTTKRTPLVPSQPGTFGDTQATKGYLNSMPWWSYVLAAQCCCLVAAVAYVVHLRGRLRGLPSSPTAAGRRSSFVVGREAPPTPTLRVGEHNAGSPLRLRGLAAFTRGAASRFAGPSPAGRSSDSVRSIVASPQSAYGPRTPGWRPEDE